jgi:hypothetical protein
MGLATFSLMALGLSLRVLGARLGRMLCHEPLVATAGSELVVLEGRRDAFPAGESGVEPPALQDTGV